MDRLSLGLAALVLALVLVPLALSWNMLALALDPGWSSWSIDGSSALPSGRVEITGACIDVDRMATGTYEVRHKNSTRTRAETFAPLVAIGTPPEAPVRFLVGLGEPPAQRCPTGAPILVTVAPSLWERSSPRPETKAALAEAGAVLAQDLRVLEQGWVSPRDAGVRAACVLALPWMLAVALIGRTFGKSVRSLRGAANALVGVVALVALALPMLLGVGFTVHSARTSQLWSHRTLTGVCLQLDQAARVEVLPDGLATYVPLVSAGDEAGPIRALVRFRGRPPEVPCPGALDLAEVGGVDPQLVASFRRPIGQHAVLFEPWAPLIDIFVLVFFLVPLWGIVGVASIPLVIALRRRGLFSGPDREITGSP